MALSMKVFIILIMMACSAVINAKVLTNSKLTVDTAVVSCVRGTHLDNDLCVANTKYCDNYDATTKNCIDCNWYSWWTEYDTNTRPDQGSYCATHWWMMMLWALALLALLALLLACCWLCTRAPKAKAPVAKPVKVQEVHVQRQPEVHYVQRQAQPQYVYREPAPVEMVRYEQPREQNVRYEYGEPRVSYGQSQVYQSNVVDQRTSYSPSRNMGGSNMLYSNAQQGHNPYNPYN